MAGAHFCCHPVPPTPPACLPPRLPAAQLYVKDLASGKQLLARPIPDTAGNVAWANDNKTLFYVTKDKLDR